MTGMDYLNILGFLFTTIGLGVSIWAIVQAKSAKSMAQTIVGRGNDQEDTNRIRALIQGLIEAKDAAMSREGGAPSAAARGRRREEDLQALRGAADALRTKRPLKLDGELAGAMDAAATEIETAVENINSDARDGWKDARVALQALIPRIEKEERDARNRAVLAD